MHIARLLIKGFKSLKNLDVSLQPGINVFVGKNNCGKSNIMKALDFLFGEKWPTYQEVDETYYFSQRGKKASYFLIAAWLTPSLVYLDNSLRIWYKKLESEPNWDDISTLLQPTGAREYLTNEQFIDVLQHAHEIVLYLVVPKDSPRSDRVLSLAVKRQEGYWIHVTLSQDLRDAMITTALVPSFRNPNQQLKIANYTWYGKLIQQLYNRRSNEQEARIMELQQKLKEVTDEVFRESTDNLRQFLSDVIFQNRIRFQIGSDLRDDVYKGIMLFIDDGIDTPYYEKGSGIQSALIIGLFAYYCKLFHRGSSLLMVEEPELFLHPQARRAIESRLVDFVEESTADRERQVILSTHSPEFLKSVDLAGIIRLYKPTESNCTMCKRIEGLDAATLVKYRQVIRTKNAEMFFADKIILVEGGEEYILPALADKRYGSRSILDLKNVSVVRTEGKRQFVVYIGVLEKLGLEWAVLTDLDFVVDGLEQFSYLFDSAFQSNLKEFKEKLNQQNSKIRGKAVKETLCPETRDWVTLYWEVNSAIKDITNNKGLSQEQCQRISNLWNRLAERVRGSINVRQAAEEAGVDSLLDGILNQAKEKGFYIHTTGDLESCFTAQAMELGDSKDRRALEIARRIEACETYDEVGRYISNLTVFEELLDHILA